jgi:hypothetical protein
VITKCTQAAPRHYISTEDMDLHANTPFSKHQETGKRQRPNTVVSSDSSPSQPRQVGVATSAIVHWVIQS